MSQNILQPRQIVPKKFPTTILLEKNNAPTKKYELDCEDYGFECNFSVTDSDMNKVISDFQKHTLENHYIEYPEGVLMRFMMDKKACRFDA